MMTRMTFAEMDQWVSEFETLPVDVSDERIGKKRFWPELYNHLLPTHRNLQSKWLGIDVIHYSQPVCHPVFMFGNESIKSIGFLDIMQFDRQNGDRMIITEIPKKMGGMTFSACRASSQEFVALIRLLARAEM
jgi:hypothetical protein